MYFCVWICACRCPLRLEVLHSLKPETQGIVTHLIWVLGPSSCPLQDWYSLLTAKPSL